MSEAVSAQHRADHTLPTSAAGIRLNYQFETDWNYTPSDGPAFWRVSADTYDIGTETVARHVGSFTFYRIEPFETRDMFGVMDGYDADLGHIADVILDPSTGEIADALRDRMAGFTTDLLVLCRAELAEEWRGFGLGAVLAGQAIRQLGHGCLAVVLQPASILPTTGNDKVAHERAVRKIAGAWEKLGFIHFGEDLMVLDLATKTLSECLARQSSIIARLPTADDVAE